MTQRKPTHLQRMEDLKNELDTQLKFADALTEELKQMNHRNLTPEENERADEIKELLFAKKAWVDRTRAEIGAFYRPATIAG